jgi:hypothetical protein
VLCEDEVISFLLAADRAHDCERDGLERTLDREHERKAGRRWNALLGGCTASRDAARTLDSEVRCSATSVEPLGCDVRGACVRVSRAWQLEAAAARATHVGLR